MTTLLNILKSIIIIFVSGALYYILITFLQYLFNQKIPEQIFKFSFAFVSVLCGSNYIGLKYPLKFNDFGLHKNAISKSLIWGFTGGIFLSIIQFPYKTIFNNLEISTGLFLNPEYGIIYTVAFLNIVIILVPTIEEIFFRGFIYRIIKSRFGIIWGYIFTAFLFTLAHKTSIFQSILFIISSFILTFIYEKASSITSSIIAHCFWNLTWYTTIYLYYYLK
jgi:membrane protease YdiL (CAAX protease family)